ncbi:MAG: CapA family protein [Lachnospiraceae bacterium]|nr:CapA family protein [Lachnospiraceae bacterium]
MKKKILIVDAILLCILLLIGGILLIKHFGEKASSGIGAGAESTPSGTSFLVGEPIPAEQQTDSDVVSDDPVTSDTDVTAEGENGADTAVSEEEIPEEAPLEPVHIIYTGDVCVQNSIQVTYDGGGIGAILSDDLRERLNAADITVINHEFAMSDRGEPAPDKQYTFRAAPKYASLLQEMGADIASLANNHALDYGKEALSDTFTCLDAAGIDYMGAGESEGRAAEMITRQVGDYCIGFMAASRVYPVVSWNVLNSTPGMLPAYDPDYLAAQVKQKAPLCDYLIIYLHWGVERETYPEEYERTLGKMLIDAGADAVVGSHPHVLQGMEFYKGKPIFYSLGNFVFNASIARTAYLEATVDLAAAAEHGADELSDYVTWSITPCKASDYCTRVITDPAAVAEFQSYMKSISYDVDIAEDGTILNLRGN